VSQNLLTAVPNVRVLLIFRIFTTIIDYIVDYVSGNGIYVCDHIVSILSIKI
jgi:hypothetical protein